MSAASGLGDLDFNSIFGTAGGGNSVQSASDKIETHTWPPLKHKSYVAIVIVTTFCMAMTITSVGLGAHTYFSARQQNTDYDQMDLNLIVPALNESGGYSKFQFSDKCYTCTEESTYGYNGQPLPGKNKVWRFKGKLKLTESARNRMQFPTGTFIGASATILLGENTVDRTFITGARLDYRRVFMAGGRKLTTWPSYNTNSKTTFTVAPSTTQLKDASTMSVICNSFIPPNSDGNIYAVYTTPLGGTTPTGKAAVCTCAFDNGVVGSPATPYCMLLSRTTF